MDISWAGKRFVLVFIVLIDDLPRTRHVLIRSRNMAFGSMVNRSGFHASENASASAWKSPRGRQLRTTLAAAASSSRREGKERPSYLRELIRPPETSNDPSSSPISTARTRIPSATGIPGSWRCRQSFLPRLGFQTGGESQPTTPPLRASCQPLTTSLPAHTPAPHGQLLALRIRPLPRRSLLGVRQIFPV
jgi:hypothetical protein